jgi:hypothetical protein
MSSQGVGFSEGKGCGVGSRVFIDRSVSNGEEWRQTGNSSMMPESSTWSNFKIMIRTNQVQDVFRPRTGEFLDFKLYPVFG